MSVIYLFDGSHGCEFCQAATGYSIDEEPIRPHPSCNCPIVEVDPADVPGCELVLKDLIVDEFVTVEQHQVVMNGCNESTDALLNIAYDEDEEEGFDEGLKELVQASGWTPPPTGHLSVEIEISKHRIHTVDYGLERRHFLFEAEVAYACTINGEQVEVPGGQKTGFYQANFDLSIEHDVEDCPDASHEIEVPDLEDDEALAEYLDEEDEETG